MLIWLGLIGQPMAEFATCLLKVKEEEEGK